MVPVTAIESPASAMASNGVHWFLLVVLKEDSKCTTKHTDGVAAPPAGYDTHALLE